MRANHRPAARREQPLNHGTTPDSCFGDRDRHDAMFGNQPNDRNPKSPAKLAP
jgi:hypothetical protein